MMPANVVRVSRTHPDPAVMRRAANLLQTGQLVAFPTETVYGLGANALDPEAVARVYAAKGRPGWNPLIVHVADRAAAERLVLTWPEAADRLAANWWPGPLTLVLPRRPEVPDAATAGLDTVALRVPSHPIAQGLLRASGLALAAPSANRSGEVSPTTAMHVALGLGDRVPLILDGGPCEVGIESTVVDLSGPVPLLLRPGAVSQDAIVALIGALEMPGASDPGAGARRSPGMMERHYSPAATFALYDAGEDISRSEPVTRCRATGGRVAALVRESRPPGVDQIVVMPESPVEYARELYATLHRLDEGGMALILAERPPDDPAWDAIRDRLTRAAAPRPPRP